MAFRRLRFSLAQILLLVALVAILVAAGIQLSQPSGRPEYWASAVAFSPDGKTLAASLYIYHQVQARTELRVLAQMRAIRSIFSTCPTVFVYRLSAARSREAVGIGC